MRCQTYRESVTRHPTHAKTHEYLLAVLADGTPCPICSSPVFRHRMPDPHHSGAAGR